MFHLSLSRSLLMTAAAGCLLALGGCATVTAITESAIAPPTISDSLDSFESAALAIKTSNRILLHAPISEQEAWPEKLYKMPTAENTLKMAISGLGMRYGWTVPTEIDPDTGFPRPTSPLYIMIKDRNQMLSKEMRRSYIDYFRKNPDAAQCEIEEKLPDCSNEFAYRNLLMAYGTVSGNNDELAQLQEKMNQTAKGFRQCDAWVRRSNEGEVVSAYCSDSELVKDENFKQMEITKAKEEFEDYRKVYGKLSKRVYMSSVAGADFTVAAFTKLAATIVKAPQALKGAEDEIKGWKGAVNIAMLLPRIKNVISAFGIYRDNLSLQLSAYRTMYNQIQNRYDVEDTQQTREALQRIERFDLLYAALKPRLDMVLAGGESAFSADEVASLDRLASSWPDQVEAVAEAGLHR